MSFAASKIDLVVIASLIDFWKPPNFLNVFQWSTSCALGDVTQVVWFVNGWFSLTAQYHIQQTHKHIYSRLTMWWSCVCDVLEMVSPSFVVLSTSLLFCMWCSRPLSLEQKTTAREITGQSTSNFTRNRGCKKNVEEFLLRCL